MPRLQQTARITLGISHIPLNFNMLHDNTITEITPQLPSFNLFEYVSYLSNSKPYPLLLFRVVAVGHTSRTLANFMRYCDCNIWLLALSCRLGIRTYGLIFSLIILINYCTYLDQYNLMLNVIF